MEMTTDGLILSSYLAYLRPKYDLIHNKFMTYGAKTTLWKEQVGLSQVQFDMDYFLLFVL